MLKVALVGTCPSSRMLAPYNDPSWQIWACSPDNAFGRLPRADAWFELHGDLEWGESVEWGAPQYVEWLKQQTFPIYAWDRAVIPDAIALPRKKLIDKFDRYFFTSTFTWAFAFALTQGATEIGLWGIDMSTQSEYAYQRAGMQHFIWLARNNGVTVIAPDESDILQPPPLYGFVDSTPIGRKLAVRHRELSVKIDGLDKEVEAKRMASQFLKGCLEDLSWFRDTWASYEPSAFQENSKIVRLPAVPEIKIKKEA